MTDPGVNLRSESTGFARFCAIGAFGFAVDACLLMALTNWANLDPFSARLIAILIAITATWGLHRRITFRSTDPKRLAEWSRFAAVNGAGGALNYSVYSAILLALPGTAPLFALAVGSAVALSANFLGSRLWAFRNERATLP